MRHALSARGRATGNVLPTLFADDQARQAFRSAKASIKRRTNIERRSTLWLQTVLVAAIVVGTAARVEADAGVIHACVNNSDGSVRIVDPNARCRPNYTGLQWPTLARFEALEATAGLGTLCARSCQDSALGLSFTTTDSNGNPFCDPRPTYQVPCAPYACLQDEDHPASCLTGCNEDSHCTAGNVCSPWHQCVPYVFSCSEGPDGPQTGGTLEGTDGSTVSCSGYGCEGSICRVSCDSIADCAPGYLCNANHHCIPYP
jgi:hypothetical protein